MDCLNLHNFSWFPPIVFVCDSIKLQNLLDSRIFEGNYSTNVCLSSPYLLSVARLPPNTAIQLTGHKLFSTLYRHSETLDSGAQMHTLKPCKTRQPSVEFRTDQQSYPESDENNYLPYTNQSKP